MVKKLFSEIYVKEYLPLIRKEIALNLNKKGYKQKEIAEMLNIDQTTVSNYLNSATKEEISQKLKYLLRKKSTEIIFRKPGERLAVLDEIKEHIKQDLKVRKKDIYYDM